MRSTEREGLHHHEMSGRRLVEGLGLSMGEARDRYVFMGNRGDNDVLIAGRTYAEKPARQSREDLLRAGKSEYGNKIHYCTSLLGH
jgi:hypothetical protein